MPIIRLILQKPGAAARREPLFVPASTALGRTYFPTRGVFYSLSLHGIVYTLLYFFASFPIGPPPEEPLPRENIVMIDLNDPIKASDVQLLGCIIRAGTEQVRALLRQADPGARPGRHGEGQLTAALLIGFPVVEEVRVIPVH